MINELRQSWHLRRLAAQKRMQLYGWKLQYSLARMRLSEFGLSRQNDNPDSVTMVQNCLPNTGGLPVDPMLDTPQSILSSVINPACRSANVAGFEGLALDDGLVFTDEYKHFSYFRLAKAIGWIARDQLRRSRGSLLELGCGGGDLFRFLRLFGFNQYIGVDGNPVALRYSPHVQGYERHFRLLNLQQEIDFRMLFDVVCSFEVLEHIPEAQLDHFIKTIRNHLGSHSLFLGTASLQSGLDVHVTVRPRSFWLEQFRRFGLAPHPKHRVYEQLLATHHPFNWDASNTNVFALSVVNE